ncbi:GNAT family N-acetyltransferase [Microbacterium sp. PMB16]|uniref:GNAT family N-acetyltransferase n=1 Tax=Microbacterium sp. PMB16 TaxID=3120157 RepID=UPI003F4C852D
MTFTIAAWDGSDEQLSHAAELYAEVFTEPPYDEDRSESAASFESRAQRYAVEKPEPRLLIATEDSHVVGLVLGSGVARGDWWWDRLEAALPADAKREWLHPECFSVAELAVAASHRRRGLAAALMDAVLHDLPYGIALLGCYQDAFPAQRLYSGLGWKVVDPAVRVTETRAIQVMGIRLND